MTALLRYSLLAGGALLLFMVTAPGPALAQEGTAQVRADPTILKVGEGQVETLRILIVDAHDLYGIDLQAIFDPTYLEIVDADPKQDGVQMAPGDFLKPDFVVRNTIDNQAGTLRYVATQLKPTLPANGKGLILSIQFRGKRAGTRTKLTFVSVQIADRYGVKQPVTAQGADLMVVTPKLPTRTPVPTVTHAPTATRVPTRTPKPSRTPTNLHKPSTTFTPTFTRSRLLPTFTARPTRTPSQTISPASSKKSTGLSAPLLMIITIGGFSGALVLFGLTLWLSARRRKHRRGKSK